MLTHWSGPAKMGKSHFMSMEDHVLDQRMLVRTSLGGMLLVLTSNNSVTKANNTFTCERNFAATVKFSLSLSLRPSIPYGCNFTGKKKKSTGNGLNKPVMSFLRSAKQSEMRKNEIVVFCFFF